MKNDEFEIKLDVAGRQYPVMIKRGDEQQEFLVRKAAKRVQQHVIQHRQHYAKTVKERDLLAMIAIQLALEVIILENKNDTKPFTQKIQQLTETLEDCLQNK